MTWQDFIRQELTQPYMQELFGFLEAELSAGKVIYPEPDNIFRAFGETPVESIKVVIIGQDPYHGPGQAQGLSFSVPVGTRIPPSLKNIFIEINQELGTPLPAHGDLTAWARQGVLLLNNVLTVEAGKAGSHGKKGWDKFTDNAVKFLSDNTKGVVFLLWGKDARTKLPMITRDRDHVALTAPHPSPFSANTGFFGCQHFKMANEYLALTGKDPVDWSLVSL